MAGETYLGLPSLSSVRPILDPSSGQVLNPYGLIENLSEDDTDLVATINRISRFSTQDGPGIRFTVFVKGCTLACEWCSNPETWVMKPQIAHKDRECNQCNDIDGGPLCVAACPQSANTLSGFSIWVTPDEPEADVKGGPRIDRDSCTECGLCVEACPTGAVFWYGWKETVGQMLHRILADKDYYAQSGGGLTVSGGEPLMQAGYVAELFRRAQEHGIHTCLDTSGSGSVHQLEQVLPHTDLFHFDLKVIDPTDHQRWTKASNRAILRNIRIVARAGKRIIIRVPMIPGIIDTTDNLREIAVIAEELDQLETAVSGPAVEVELLPYHRGGVGKFYEMDKPYTLEELRTQSDEDLREMLAIFRNKNVKSRVEGRDF